MMIKTTVLFLGLFALTGHAFAEPPHGKHAETHHKKGHDGDVKHGGKHMTEKHHNKNTRQRGRFYRNGSPFLDRFDSNGDGSITHEEFSSKAFERFDNLDTNKDGRVDSNDRGVRYMRADRNRDGKITKAEHDAMISEHFGRLDRNKDGQIDKRDRPDTP